MKPRFYKPHIVRVMGYRLRAVALFRYVTSQSMSSTNTSDPLDAKISMGYQLSGWVITNGVGGCGLL